MGIPRAGNGLFVGSPFSKLSAGLYLPETSVLRGNRFGSPRVGPRLLCGRNCKVWFAEIILWTIVGPLVGQAKELPADPDAPSSLEPPSTVLLDRADAAVLGELDRAKALLATRQWEEGMETLRQVMERSGNKLVPVSPSRFIPVRDYGHLVLSGLPSEGLAVYRRQVDGLAQKWYEEGLGQRDPHLLRQVVEQAFNSSFGDDALWVLGEMALEEGRYCQARGYWERLVPLQGRGEGGVPTWLAYPDPSMDIAAVRARLVWTSILEGSLQRAREELDRLAELHPQAKGRFAGQEVRLVEFLEHKLAEAPHWPKKKISHDWLTFGGTASRNGSVVEGPPLGPVRWRLELPRCASGRAGGLSQPTVAERAEVPLCYFPVLAGGRVFVNTLWEIYGWDLHTGKPLWGQGRIYQDPLDPSAREALVPDQMWGTPRCTLTVQGSRLYARMGCPVTFWGQESGSPSAGGYLVCLDLEAEGRLVWKLMPEEKGWAFEGSPVADSHAVYAAMRRSELGPHVQMYVACWDTDTGRLRWRSFVCGGEMPTRGGLAQTSHQLLTLEGDVLYYNTNVGAVAALNTSNGRLQWVSLYPQARQGAGGRLAWHWGRDLNPCLYDRGVLYVAPADSPSVFALESATGHILWQTGPEVEDVVHLLGVWEDRFIATGHRVYGIAVSGPRRGQVVFRWPDGPEHLGYGRGLLAGSRIYWPTRDAIHILGAGTGRPIRELLLRPLGVGGGHLLVSEDQWIIATENALIGLDPNPLHKEPKKEEHIR